MIRISKWQPPTGKSSRYYLNGLPGIPNGGKAWVEFFRGKAYLKIAPHNSVDMTLRDVLQRLLESGSISDQEFNNPSTEMFERLSADEPLPPRRMAADSDNTIPLNSKFTSIAHPIALDKPVTIQVDHREPVAIIEAFEGIKGVTVETVVLPVGDFKFQGGIVERKTAFDFAQSVIDRRLFTQSDEMAAMDDKILRAVILEGDVYSIGRLNTNALDGAISYLAVLQGISVLNSSSPQHTANLVARMASHSVYGLGYEISYRPAKPKPIEDQILYIIQGMPGIGIEVGKALLSHFGTLANIFAADQAQFQKVEGIGKKMAEKIHQILHQEWKK